MNLRRYSRTPLGVLYFCLPVPTHGHFYDCFDRRPVYTGDPIPNGGGPNVDMTLDYLVLCLVVS